RRAHTAAAEQGSAGGAEAVELGHAQAGAAAGAVRDGGGADGGVASVRLSHLAIRGLRRYAAGAGDWCVGGSSLVWSGVVTRWARPLGADGGVAAVRLGHVAIRGVRRYGAGGKGFGGYGASS
ncbi:unnamed protein product, partial [Closterium sp. Naga37s-1]